MTPRRALVPRHRDRLSADHGVATLEGVIVAPIVIFATMVVVQLACYYMANTTATNAAQISVEAARVQGATDAQGVRAGQEYLANVDALSGAEVSVGRAGGRVTAVVTAPAPSIVPLVPLPEVRSEINAPVERVTQP